MRRLSSLAAVSLCLTLPLAVASAQTTPGAPTVGPSGRALAAVCRANSCRATDPNTLDFYIEYGQPHARGRTVAGGLIPLDSVWRLGANPATHLTVKSGLMLGGQHVPAGTYTLGLIYSKSGSKLIINKATGQWGVPYDASRVATELARVPIRVRELREPMETLSIALVPKVAAGANSTSTGVMTITWGTLEFAIDWQVH
jgi:hypothetical protein